MFHSHQNVSCMVWEASLPVAQLSESKMLSLTSQLLPYKSQVIRALAKPLDDKKRLVRKEAVSARGEW